MLGEEQARSFAGKKVILAVSGGIAAYKIVQLARDLAKLGADVRVVMTRSAERFVGRQTFAALTGNPVSTDLFSSNGADVPHVELARGADLAIVAPATANTIAKIAGGFADDLVSATLLTVTCPVLVVPAMHTEMWMNPATEHNMAVLLGRGSYVLGPVAGELSSGDEGVGRMVEPEEILVEAAEILTRASELDGRRILITAGGTREAIDPVRYIGNHSSGRMGYVLAEEAARRGAKVILVSGSTHLRPPVGVEVVKASSAEEMHRAVLGHAHEADVIIKAAAVADFRPDASAAAKLKKDAGVPEIVLVPTTDILKELGHDPSLRKAGGVLVGFAAETVEDEEDLVHLAEHKLKVKGADVIVANQVGVHDSGFEVPTNRAVIATRDGVERLGLVTKLALSKRLLDRVAELLHG
ncbi:MAG: bifunctional phosphopantothenoylcysteine decarboxylase/phosphopantothenate--cysteine ligase CoaBC [Actinomycetota bacterium]